MKWLFTFIIFSFLRPGFGQSVPDTSHFAILPYQLSAQTTLPRHCRPATLNAADYVRLENILSSCIDQYNETQLKEYKKISKKHPEKGFKEKDFVISLSRYYRQYVVVFNAKGEKEVWVNCFCENWSVDYWRKELVMVKDGGNCFFNLRINLTRGIFSDFGVNGEA